MKQWIKFSIPVVAGLIGLNASAIPIVGSVQMSGSVTLDGPFATATTATFNTSGPAGFVVSGTTAYASVPILTPVFFSSPLIFNPLGNQNTPITDLWSFTTGGQTYSFNLLNITSEQMVTGGSGTQFLNLAGSGTLDITGGLYDETIANWSFSISDTGAGTLTFGFSDSNTAAPDGGMTVMMLGAALTGLGLIKRKLA